MLEFLKKIGLPGIIAAIISAVVTMIPFLFQLDERYAKADEIDQRIAVLTKQTTDLTIEVGRLAGTTQVLVSVMSKSERTDKASFVEQPHTVSVPTTLKPLTVAPSLPNTFTRDDKKAKLDEVSRSLDRTQQKVEAIKRY